jgi:hypothetical protein
MQVPPEQQSKTAEAELGAARAGISIPLLPDIARKGRGRIGDLHVVAGACHDRPQRAPKKS